MNFSIGQKDRMITLQFSFPNDDAVPIGLRSMKSETEEMATARRNGCKSPAGVDLLNGAYPEKTNLVDFPISIVRNGYVLVNALYQSRRDQHDSSKTYHMIRFAFARKNFEDLSDERLQKFLPYRGLMLAELQEVCSLAFWRVRLFRNQYYREGNPTGHNAISINLEGRRPLFERDNPNLVVIPTEEPVHEMFVKNSCVYIKKI